MSGLKGGRPADESKNEYARQLLGERTEDGSDWRYGVKAVLELVKTRFNSSIGIPQAQRLRDEVRGVVVVDDLADVLALQMGALQPDPINASIREIDPRSLTGLTFSVEEFGDIGGIFWNRRTQQLGGGHQRVDALKQAAESRGVQLRLERLAPGWLVIRLPAAEDKPAYEWPVRVVDWDLETQRAANVTANNPEIQGRFRAEIEPLLAELAQSRPVLYEVTGLDRLLQELQDGGGKGGEGGGAPDGSGKTPPNLDPGESRYKEQYGVIVVLANAKEQEDAFNDLTARGYTCKIVVT